MTLTFEGMQLLALLLLVLIISLTHELGHWAVLEHLGFKPKLHLTKCTTKIPDDREGARHWIRKHIHHKYLIRLSGIPFSIIPCILFSLVLFYDDGIPLWGVFAVGITLSLGNAIGDFISLYKLNPKRLVKRMPKAKKKARKTLLCWEIIEEMYGGEGK